MNGLCKIHGKEADISKDGRRWRCKDCLAAHNRNKRRTIKQMLVDEAGGGCIVCGYNRSMRALHFHHKDPSLKEFKISITRSKSMEALRKEIEKCILLCSNHHMELEDGLLDIDEII